ncbi:MAG: hypothetical protein WCT37_01910 [Patescibacteria group bacterium]|jgi:hypothetical protein
MTKKFLIFLNVVQALNHHGIVPILYGSLGVARYVTVKDVNDIDIIIPDRWLNSKFSKFKKIMASIGYRQDHLYPHEFTKNRQQIGFEPASDLKNWDINPKDVKITEIKGIKFGELSAHDYLNIYQKYLKLWERKIAKMKAKITSLKSLDI